MLSFKLVPEQKITTIADGSVDLGLIDMDGIVYIQPEVRLDPWDLFQLALKAAEINNHGWQSSNEEKCPECSGNSYFPQITNGKPCSKRSFHGASVNLHKYLLKLVSQEKRS